MQFTEGTLGRVFVLRLEDGDELKATLEGFAREHGIQHGYVNFLGAVMSGEVICGPETEQGRPVKPIARQVSQVHDLSAAGLIAPGEDEKPVLHLHGALGRGNEAMNGCLRGGMKTWLTGEAIVHEILGVNCHRVKEGETGLTVLAVTESTKSARQAAAVATTSTGPKKLDDRYSHVLHLFNVFPN